MVAEVDFGALRVLNEWDGHRGSPFADFDRDREERADVC